MINLPSESDCLERLKDIVLKRGLSCDKCGGKTFYWKQNRALFECKNSNCKATISLKGLTKMRGSKLPVSIWLGALYLISCDYGITAKELGDTLNFNTYSSIWDLKFRIDEIEKGLTAQQTAYMEGNKTIAFPNHLSSLELLGAIYNFKESELMEVQDHIWKWLIGL